MKNIVKQRHGTDCGVACLAMILEEDYEYAEKLVCTILGRKAPISFMDNVEIAMVLKVNRLESAQVYTILEGVPAIISVPSLMTKKKFHYVYWDGFKIYDPSNYECYTTEDFKKDLPMADSVALTHKITKLLPSHLYSEFDWEFINK